MAKISATLPLSQWMSIFSLTFGNVCRSVQNNVQGNSKGALRKTNKSLASEALIGMEPGQDFLE